MLKMCKVQRGVRMAAVCESRVPAPCFNQVFIYERAGEEQQ